jgi:type III pantothenate kinase
MLLFIDAGNTRIKWAVSEANAHVHVHDIAWQCAGELAHADLMTLHQAWEALHITRVIIANVAGPVIQTQLTQQVHTCFGHGIEITWFSASAQCAGVVNGYQSPSKLGCDRFASLIAMRAMYPQQDVIIATFGTATTIDTLRADGHFMGGLILPGVGLMANALAVNTAQLPQISAMTQTVTTYADNTVDAIVSGCVQAQVGALERVLSAHRSTFGAVRCVLAGGAGKLIAPYVTQPYDLRDNTVLTGLFVATVMPTESVSRGK